MKNYFLHFMLAFFLVSFQPTHLFSATNAVNLKIENRSNPLGIDAVQPRFSWQLQSTQDGTIQNAYQILVADSPEKLCKEKELVWNSGKVQSGILILIPYNGTKLASTKCSFWIV